MLLTSAPVRAQDAAAIDHAKRVMDSIVKEQFEAVAKEFTPQMAAALSTQKLQEVWKTLLQQTGAFKSIVDERSQTAGGGVTAVTLGCQFERAVLNAIVAFDAEAKIAGLRFVPRPVAAAPATSPPPGSRFREQRATVGAEPGLDRVKAHGNGHRRHRDLGKATEKEMTIVAALPGPFEVPPTSGSTENSLLR